MFKVEVKHSDAGCQAFNVLLSKPNKERAAIFFFFFFSIKREDLTQNLLTHDNPLLGYAIHIMWRRTRSDQVGFNTFLHDCVFLKLTTGWFNTLATSHTHSLLRWDPVPRRTHTAFYTVVLSTRRHIHTSQLRRYVLIENEIYEDPHYLLSTSISSTCDVPSKQNMNGEFKQRLVMITHYGTTRFLPLLHGTTRFLPLLHGTTRFLPLLHGTTHFLPLLHRTTHFLPVFHKNVWFHAHRNIHFFM